MAKGLKERSVWVGSVQDGFDTLTAVGSIFFSISQTHLETVFDLANQQNAETEVILLRKFC